MIANAEVQQVVVEQTADEELDGEVVDALLALGAVALVGLGSDDAGIAGDHIGQRGEAVDIARILELLTGQCAHVLAVLS